VLGVATGISWGFMAAVIKELSSHIDDGIGAIFGTWSLYVLITAGAATMLLASHALAAGPLAASQPGFTILDPFSASLLGVFLFGEHIRTGVTDLAGEALALGVVVAGAAVLSRSCLIAGENGHQPGERKTAVSLVTAGRAATPQARQANRPDGPLPTSDRTSPRVSAGRTRCSAVRLFARLWRGLLRNQRRPGLVITTHRPAVLGGSVDLVGVAAGDADWGDLCGAGCSVGQSGPLFSLGCGREMAGVGGWFQLSVFGGVRVRRLVRGSLRRESGRRAW